MKFILTSTSLAVLGCLVAVLSCLVITACGTRGGTSSGATKTPTPIASAPSPILSNLESFGWTVASAYEKANTGGVLTQTIASTILAETKSNASTTAEVLLATSLADKVAAAGVAAHDAGASPQGVTNAQTALLSDPGVIQTVALSASSAPTK